MGKRKYDNEDGEVTKKSKQEGKSENNELQPKNENSVPANDEKRASFNVKHFRKELAMKQGQTITLTQFLQVCLNPDNERDYLLDYINAGGNSHEILRQIPGDQKQNITLATPAFHIFHLIILKVQSSAPHMIAITEEACRYFLNMFMSTVEIMISENSGPRHKKIILKLLTSMTTLNPDLGVEILTQMPLAPMHLQHIVEKPNYKESDNVRTAFVHFITSFLIEGHLPLVKALLEKRGLLALIIPGLVHDEPEASLMFLNILKKNVIDTHLISKSLKLKLFSHLVLHNMFKIFSWRGPPDLDAELKNEAKLEITKLMSEIMVTLFTSHKIGLYFTDTSLGTSDLNKNQNLYNALLTLKRPWENEAQSQVILDIIHRCPDLHRAIINIIQQSFEPQHTLVWAKTVAFFEQLMDRLNPEDMFVRITALNNIQAANIIRFLTLPVPLLKNIYNTLGKDQQVSIYCVKVLVRMLSSLKCYIQLLEAENLYDEVTELKNRLEPFFVKHLPPPVTVVALIEQELNGEEEMTEEYKLPSLGDVESLLLLIDLLLLYHDVQPAFLEGLDGTLDMSKVMIYSTSLKSENASLLQFKIVSLWAALDPSVMSVKNPMFKDLFLIMLHVYTNEKNAWVEAKDTLEKYFENTRIFEADEDEIYVMLYALHHAKVEPVSVIADVIEYVLAKGSLLLKKLHKRTVHLESAEGDAKAKLNKLLDDLTEGKVTEDGDFIESLIPSTFIIGCIHFLTDNVSNNESLKQFLSVYIANLLHKNCSPEWTLAMIGDCDLEVKNYVNHWINPIGIDEMISPGDITIRKIGKAISNDDEFFLEETLQGITECTDTTNVFIWANYLSFCLIRLAEGGKLTEILMERIQKLWSAVLGVGRLRRQLLTRLIKRPRLLMLHTAITESQTSSVALATKFLLDSINELQDISELLRPYRMKNYQNICKALTKDLVQYDNAYTVRVLRGIGMLNEDDLKVSKLICKLDTNVFIGKDGEASIALDILCAMLEKYSERADPELHMNAVKGIVKLYIALLSTHVNDIRTAPLETAIANLLLKHPPRIPLFTPQGFKLFFEIETIRSSTAQLAAILLKFDQRLCQVYSEEVKRPEVLVRREVTLPLGDALLEHRRYVNKDLLLVIWSEYKTKVMKLLEKPSKLGRVYETHWRLIRKLLLECAEQEDCVKMFGKLHKFDSFEIAHARFFHSLFLRACLLEGMRKKDYLINYLMDMLNILTTALRQPAEVSMVSEVVYMVIEACRVSATLEGFDVKQKDEFDKVIVSSTWTNFYNAVFVTSLDAEKGSEEIRPKLLGLLSRLVKLFYSVSNNSVVQVLEALMAQPGLSGVLLSADEDARSRLAELLYLLALRCDTETLAMLSKQSNLLLAAYRARTRPSDRLILMLLKLLESKLPNGNLHMHLWGDAAARHYHVRDSNRTPTTLWGRSSPDVVLNLFDRDMIEQTIKLFPINQQLDYEYRLPPIASEPIEVFNATDNEGVLTAILQDATREELTKTKTDFIDEEIYDPSFLLPILSRALSIDGSGGGRALRRGLLAVAVTALSSRCPRMRAAACHVLHLYCKHNIPDSHFSKNKNDKVLMTSFVDTLRRSLQGAVCKSEDVEMFVQDFRNPRIPAICALFLARALMVALSPSHNLYKSVHNFLIAKERIDLTIIPDFLALFHDGEADAVEKRYWILDVIADGIKSYTDVEVVFKTMSLKMILDAYDSTFSDKKLKFFVIKALGAVLGVPRAVTILIRGYGLMPWLKTVLNSVLDKHEYHGLLSAILGLFKSLVLNYYSGEDKVDKDIEFEIGLMLSGLVKVVGIFEVDDFFVYVQTVAMLSRKAVKALNKNVFIKLINASGVDRDVAIVLNRVVETKERCYLKSVFLDNNSDKFTKELINVVGKYLG